MTGARFARALNADNLNVGSDLVMRDGTAFGGDVNLARATVGGSVNMTGAAFAKALNGSGLSIASDFVIHDGTAFGGDGNLSAAKVGRSLGISRATASGDVSLIGATVGGGFEMTGATFARKLVATSLRVEGILIVTGNTMFGADVALVAAKLGALYLSGATTNRLDLSGSVITQELRIANLGWRCATSSAPSGVPREDLGIQVDASPQHWVLGNPAWRNARCGQPNGSATEPSLILRNVLAGTFQDTSNTWPPSMDLEGFHYDRIGGLGGTGTNDMRARSPEQWEDWLARDTTFSTQPYTQLASVLFAAGHRDTAERINTPGANAGAVKPGHAATGSNGSG